MKKYLFPVSVIAVGLQLLASTCLNAQIGTWTKVATNAPTANEGVTVLLTDGTVICHNTAGGSYGTGWNKLTPSAAGSYVNGTWSTIANMNYPRLFFSTQVLPTGEVYVAGGEYGTGGEHGEVYNPATNTWTVCGNIPSGWNLYDSPSELLYTGNILQGPEIGANGGQPCNSILQWSPTTLDYTTETKEPENHDEAQWLKLPDSSVLTVGMPYPSFPANDSSCRFLPKTNTWLVDAMTPNNIYDEYGFESGPGFLLPNGKAIFFGATKYNVIYTPTGHPTVGSWASAADFPTIRGSQVGQTDAPGAMMVNGHILLAVSPAGTRTLEDQDPIYFLEYDYTTNTFTQVTSPITGIGGDSIPNNSCFQCQMLDLPDGTVLVSISQSTTYSKEYWVYTPGSAAIAQGKPTINSILPDGCPNYKVTGKLFNGISEGAAYGDDWQIATNYPLVRLSNGTDVYYAKTTNWNRVGAVQTDSLEDTAVFTVPTLPAGTYSLVVVANGFASNPVLFTVLGISSVTETNITCTTSVGSATVTASGGLTPLTYVWTPGGYTSSSVSNLTAGVYSITVTDDNGCTATASVTVTQAANFTVTAGTTANVTCNGGSNGSVSSTVSTGGTTPYTYSWSGGAGTNSSASGLSAGTYTLTVKDGCGSTETASTTVTQPASTFGITIASHTNISCVGGTGSATANAATGGTSPYTYSWSGGGGTNLTATSLAAGTYTITATENGGCGVATATVTITQPATSVGISINTLTNINCSGSSTGSITANAATGGTSPYVYSWTSGGGTNLTSSNLAAGSYTITATDNGGCTATASAVITQPATAPAVSIATQTNVSCNGNSDGTATANAASGGTAPYTYAWTSGGGTNLSASNLAAGTYTITTTDNSGCTATASVTITEPSILGISISSQANVTCNSAGSATANTATGGTAPYTYNWSSGAGTNLTASNLSAGIYTITATDNNACTATASVTITQSATTVGISISAQTNVSCNGASTGSATANSATGGTSPYTYNWSSGGGTNLTASNLVAGSYTITASDNNGCVGSATVIITQPNSLAISASVISNVICNGGTSGSAATSLSGGTSPYTYTWSGGAGSTATVNGLLAGTYIITASDSCGGSATASVIITQPDALTTAAITTANVSCNGSANGSASTNPSGGTSPYTYTWSGGGGSGAAATGLVAGTYTVTVNDGCGASATASAIITGPNPLTVSAATTGNVGCNGGASGSASASQSGGTSPYTFSWSGGGGNTSTANGLIAGTYTITISDSCGSSATGSVIITQPDALSISANTTDNVSCNGGANGLASASLSGGTSPYTYLWSDSNSGTTNTATGLSAGTYTVTVSDFCGASETTSVIITQPNALSVNSNFTATDSGVCTGSAWVQVSGGSGAYTYSWSGGLTTDSIGNLCAANYCCLVKDANGCMSNLCVTVPISTGIQNIVSAAIEITVYPNPNRGIFIMKCPEFNNNTSVEIYNVLGEKIYSQFNLHNPTFNINLSSQPSGVYFYRALNENGNLLGCGKIVIEK